MRKTLGLLCLGLGVGLAFVVDGCSSSSGGGGGIPLGPADNMNVISFSPTLLATGVPISAQIRLTFDEDVNQTTLTTTNVVVTDAGGVIAGGIVYDTNTRTAVFTPTANFPPSSQIDVSVSGNVLSTTGQFTNPGTLRFNTGTMADVTAPVFAGATMAAPESGATILVSWGNGVTDDMDPGAAVSYNIYRSTTTGTQNFTAPVGVAGPGTTAFLDSGLTASTAYFYVVRAMDTTGNEETNVVEVTISTNANTSWSTQVYPLFVGAGPADCTVMGCHDAVTVAGGLRLDTIATAYSELALFSAADGGCSQLQRVEPGDRGDSFLYEKLVGTPTCGSAMPMNAALFSNAELDLVGDWIDEGAQNN